MKTRRQDYRTTGPRLTSHVSRITHHVSRITHHASRITHHVSRPHAFTLIELLTVIAIMGILAAIALPSLNSLKPNAAAAATRQMLDAVNHARQLAISQRTTVYMVFVPPSYWTDAAYNYANWSTNDQTMVTSLFDKQLVGYAYVSLRSVGDQPGLDASHKRYLSSWRTLPQGAYIPPEKFTPYNSLSLPPRVFQIVTNGINAYKVFAFNRTTSVPYPTETTRPFSTARPYISLPYIAFDGSGQLVSGSGTQAEFIPISQGSVAFPRDPATRQAIAQPPSVREVPPGNTTNNFNLVYIDQLTGRARIEHTKVQ